MLKPARLSQGRHRNHMGSKVYDFLTESILFDDSLIREEFRTVPDSELLNELQRYRQFCLSVAHELEEDALSNTSKLKVFSGIKHVNLNLLKQSAFYVQQHVLYDPLFTLTAIPTAQSKTLSKFLGLNEPALDKAEIARTLNYLKALTPMVATNYVKLLPTSYFFESPEEVPFTYSESGFADRVPSSLLSFFHDRAIVETGTKSDKGIVFDGTFGLGRNIHVRFREHGFEDTYGYVLSKMKVINNDRDSRTVEFGMSRPEDPPDKALFEAWVGQSINQTAGYIYHRLLIENSFSAKLSASYLTESPFLFDLLEQIVPVEDDIQVNSMNGILNMNLPFLDDIGIETLMKIRSEDGEAFENFRVEMDKQLRDLRQVDDPETLRIKTDNVVHELTEVQVRQIDRKIAFLKEKFFAETVLAAASLSVAIQSGGWTLPVALMAAFQGYKSLTEYRRQKKENPAFFLWKVLKHAKKGP